MHGKIRQIKNRQISSRSAILDVSTLGRGTKPMRTIAITFLLVTLAADIEGADEVLRLHAALSRLTAPVGTPVVLTVTIDNAGSSPLIAAVAESNFELLVSRADKLTRVAVPHFDEPTSDIAEHCVPLRPRSAYKWQLPVSLNSFDAVPATGWHPQPGTYLVRVRYVPSKECAHGVVDHPATSPAVKIRIMDVSPKEKDRHLASLLSCSRSEACDTIAVGNTYVVIRDPRATEPLFNLLRRAPQDTWLLDAIVAQGRAQDATPLEAMVPELKDTSLVPIYRTAINRLRGTL